MRHGKIGWCAAFLAGLASVTQAAAPPNRGVEKTDAEVRAWVSGNIGPEGWKRTPSRRQREAVARAGACREGCLSGDIPGSARTYTIVVRIKEGLADPNNGLPFNPFRRKVALPSRQAVVRGLRAVTPNGVGIWNGVPAFEIDSEPLHCRLAEEANSVLATLQDKLLELHEPGVFELAVDGFRTDHAEVNINYEPVDPPPAPVDFHPWEGCYSGFGIEF